MMALDASFQGILDRRLSRLRRSRRLRMITNRLLMLIRTSTAHGPLVPDATAVPPVTLAGDIITSNFIELIDSEGNELRVEYRDANDQLWLVITPAGTTTEQQQPLLGGVTAAQFFSVRRQDDSGVWVLDRATMDITVEPDDDNTLAIEASDTAPIRIIASTMPRKLD